VQSDVKVYSKSYLNYYFVLVIIDLLFSFQQRLFLRTTNLYYNDIRQLNKSYICIMTMLKYLFDYQEQFFSYPGAVTITDNRVANLDLFSKRMAYNSESIFT
jgi:hypothetical protein